MKRYLIRCMGTILSVLTGYFMTQPKDAMAEGYSGSTYTLGNDQYTITYYTGAAWYVGWTNLNTPSPSSSQVTTRDKLFVMDAQSGRVAQPLVPYYHYSGYTGVAVSARTLSYGRMRGGDSFSRTSRLIGAGYQGFLMETKSWPTSMKLVYAPTTTPFTNAGCCYYSSPIKAGDARGFSYSGDGRGGNACPCFYTQADKVYTGATCAYYEGKDKDYCTGVGVIATSPGAANIGTGDYTSSNWPAVIRNVYYCYTHKSCKSSSQYLPFDPKNGYTGQAGAVCHMIRIPIGGLWVNNTVTEDITSGSNGFFDPVLTKTMRCVTNATYASCASGINGIAGIDYLHNGGKTCTTCPVSDGFSPLQGPSGQSVIVTGGTYGVVAGEYGSTACYVRTPKGRDDYGDFTIVTPNGGTQQCNYGGGS